MLALRLAAFMLLLAPVAAAQGPMTTADVTVTLDTADATVPLGGNSTAVVTVELDLGPQFICAAEDTVDVSLSVDADATANGVTTTLTEDSFTYTIDAGPHPNGFADSQSTDLMFAVGTNAPPDTVVVYTVTAEFSGGSVCVATSPFPAATGTADFTLTTGPSLAPPIDEDNETGGGGGNGIPGPAAPLVILGVIGLVALVRRRED